MDAVMANIYERRSVRDFSEKEVDDGTIKEIIKAGTFAANGGNTQGLRFVVISDKEALKKYSTIAKRITVSGMVQQLATAPAEKKPWMEKTINNLSNPLNNIFHNAPVAIMVFAAPSCLTPVEDASLAAGNMMLAAWSMGVGSCWIGFAAPLQFSPEFMAEVEMPKDHRLIAPLIFGYPAKAPGKGHRKEAQIVKWLR